MYGGLSEAVPPALKKGSVSFTFPFSFQSPFLSIGRMDAFALPFPGWQPEQGAKLGVSSPKAAEG